MLGDQLKAQFKVFILNVPMLTKLEFGHNCCAIVEQAREQCSSCDSLSNTLRIHNVWIEKQKKELRVRIPMGSSKKLKIVHRD